MGTKIVNKIFVNKLAFPNKGPWKTLQSCPPVTGLLKWEILESALGSALEGALRGVLPRVLREIEGALESAPESALPVNAPH